MGEASWVLPVLVGLLIVIALLAGALMLWRQRGLRRRKGEGEGRDR